MFVYIWDCVNDRTGSQPEWMSDKVRVQHGSDLDGVHGCPEHWVVVFDRAPVLGPTGAGQVTAIFLQDIQGCGQSLESADDLGKEVRSGVRHKDEG